MSSAVAGVSITARWPRFRFFPGALAGLRDASIEAAIAARTVKISAHRDDRPERSVQTCFGRRLTRDIFEADCIQAMASPPIFSNIPTAVIALVTNPDRFKGDVSSSSG
jgi:hypothetical protein